MFSSICKGFLNIDGKALHFVRQGKGPALVLLHAAPCSAKVMAPLQAMWSANFTTVAFDLPGFGFSDPPDAEIVATAQLADIVADGIRRLGLSRVTLYGRHTGAGVAVEIARRHPDLCHFILTDGYPVFAVPYTDERLAEYLPAIEPQWDGGHLTWTWFRYREQHVFWPWDRPTSAQRADTDIPDLDFLYRGTTELLTSADTYARIYTSAFQHKGLAVIDEVKVPVCFGNRPGDSQFKTVASYPAHADTRVFSRNSEKAAEEELALLLSHRPETSAPEGGSMTEIFFDRMRGYVDLSAGATYVRGVRMNDPGMPTLYIPALPGSVDLHSDDMAMVTSDGPLIAFDPWGNGNSALPEGEQISVQAWAKQAADVSRHFGFTKVRIYGNCTGAAVALQALRDEPDLFVEAKLRSPAVVEQDGLEQFAEDYAPDINPAWDGGNFLRLWHHLRDQELWFPWNRRTIDHVRRNEARIEPRLLNARAIVLMRQPEHYQRIWKAVLLFPTLNAIRALAGQIEVVSEPEDLFAPHAEEAVTAARPAQ